MKKVKIVFIGAGSASFGVGIIKDLLSSKELKELDINFTLVDINKDVLNIMFQFANIVKAHYNSKVTIEATTDRKDALVGANYVITAVAIKRMQLWEQDFYVPHTYGFRQVLGENGGPGGAFHTLRSLHLMLPICKEMEEICPEALLINFTNPESRVCLGISKLTRIRVVGVCAGAFITKNFVAQILERDNNEIDITIGGINHFHWVLEIKDKSTGENLYPEFHKRMKNPSIEIEPLSYLMYQKFGLLPFPLDTHIGEYVSFAYDICGPKWSKGKIFAKEEERKYGAKYYEIFQVIEGKKTVEEILSAEPGGELFIPIICDIEFDRNKKELSVNIPNTGYAISNLPEDAIVEIPAIINKDGIIPVKVGPLPEAIASMCMTQITIQNLLVQAYHQKSKNLLLQALLIDPVVDSIPKAEQMMEEMLKIESDFLPKFY